MSNISQKDFGTVYRGFVHHLGDMTMQTELWLYCSYSVALFGGEELIWNDLL